MKLSHNEHTKPSVDLKGSDYTSFVLSRINALIPSSYHGEQLHTNIEKTQQNYIKTSNSIETMQESAILLKQCKSQQFY